MRVLLILFTFSTAAWALPPASVPCEQRLIEASSRFRRARGSGSGSGTERHGELIPFVRGLHPELKRFVQPLQLSALDFLDHPELRNELPALRAYLESRLVRAPSVQALADQGARYVTVKVTPVELKSFFARGILPYSASHRRKTGTITNGTPVLPRTEEIICVFALNSRAMSSVAGEYPIWELRSVVAGSKVHDRIWAEALERFGATQLVRKIWSLGDIGPVLQTPMVFNLPLKPLAMFALKNPPSKEEAERTDFSEMLLDFEYPGDKGYRLRFWLPFAKSRLQVEDEFGERLTGFLVDVAPYGFMRHTRLTLLNDQGLYEYIDLRDIRRIRLLTYVPNGADGERIPLGIRDLAELDSFAAGLERSDSPQRLLILTPDEI